MARLRLKILDLKCRRKLRLSLSASVAKWRLLARVQLSDLGQDMSEHGLGKVGFISCVCPLNFVKKMSNCPRLLVVFVLKVSSYVT